MARAARRGPALRLGVLPRRLSLRLVVGEERRRQGLRVGAGDGGKARPRRGDDAELQGGADAGYRVQERRPGGTDSDDRLLRPRRKPLPLLPLLPLQLRPLCWMSAM